MPTYTASARRVRPLFEARAVEQVALGDGALCRGPLHGPAATPGVAAPAAAGSTPRRATPACGASIMTGVASPTNRAATPHAPVFQRGSQPGSTRLPTKRERHAAHSTLHS